MDTEIQIAILGILGTLAGTVLGWVLNNISQHGRINVYILYWKDKFMYNKTGSIINSNSIQQTQYYSYDSSIDLYNSSGETKIMRNIEIIFTNKKDELYHSIPMDKSTERTGVGGTVYNDILPINIPPKSVKHIEIHYGLWKSDESFDLLWDTTHIFLKYIDEKNKKKKILIKREKYKEYFNNSIPEE